MNPRSHPSHRASEYCVLEVRYVALDPVIDGFEGVVVELGYRRHPGEYLCREGSERSYPEPYVFTVSAATTGNRLLRITSASEIRVRQLLAKVFGDSSFYPLPNKEVCWERFW